MDCEILLLDLDRRSVDLGTAAHEMIHQLASNTGLVPASRRVPDLASRGIRGAVRGDSRWPLGRHQSGPRSEAPRLAVACRPRPDWSALVRDAGFGHGYQRDLYAQAWALVYYLRTQRPSSS